MSNWEVLKDNWLYKCAKDLFNVNPYDIKDFRWYYIDFRDNDVMMEGIENKELYCIYIDSIGIELYKNANYDLDPDYLKHNHINLDGIYANKGVMTIHFTDRHFNWWDIEF